MENDRVTTVITDARRKKLCAITSGAVGTMGAVSHIAFGDGGVDGAGEPTTPSGSQVALKNEVGRYALDKAAEYPAETTARYTATIPKGDLVGKRISEAALVDEDGDLVAIQTMYAKGKDAGVAFEFTFDDAF